MFSATTAPRPPTPAISAARMLYLHRQRICFSQIPLINSVCRTEAHPRVQCLRAKPWLVMGPQPQGALGPASRKDSQGRAALVPAMGAHTLSPQGLTMGASHRHAQVPQKPTHMWYPEDFPQKHSVPHVDNILDLQANCLLTNVRCPVRWRPVLKLHQVLLKVKI